MPAYGSPKLPCSAFWAGGALDGFFVSAKRKEPYMPIFLDREQRDAVRDALLTNLSGVGDIHLTLMNEDWARARRYRMEFEDDMRLLDDLGWGDDEPGERFEVTMEPVALRRLVARLHELASTELEEYLSRPVDDQVNAKSCATASVAFGVILGQLSSEPVG